MKALIIWIIKTVSGLIYDRLYIVLSFFEDINCLCPYCPVVKQEHKLNRLSPNEFG